MSERSNPESGGVVPSASASANERMQARRRANRMMAFLLVSVMLTFLAGAFGVALLVIYGPY